LVADGTYIGEGNVNINFRGKQITVKSRNGAAVTIIDCEQTPDTRGFTFQNGETNASVLDGFTIRNGMKDVGGGIYCDTAAPTIKNCIITQNRATGTGRRIWSYQGGGGIYCKSSDALIENCKITQNQAASGAGSGVFFVERSPSETLSPTLIHCTISENIGSAVFCHDYPWPLIKDCTIFQNRGPGIVCNSSGIRITNCRIEQNSSGGISGYEYSFLKINDCIIKQNTAAEGGGVYCSPTSSVEISGCIIARNTATLEGGGIYAYSSFNSAEITNCTITQNTANQRGGGIYTFVSGSIFILTNSIVWDNSAGEDREEVFAIGGPTIIRSCDIRGGLAGIGHQPDRWFIYENNIDVDPRFVDAENCDYRLKPDSPAMSMGPQYPLEVPIGVTQFGKRLITWGELKRKSLDHSSHSQ
jgi:parallel beta-helix repeat protein